MRPTILTILTVLGIIALPSSAQACRAFDPPEARIAAAYANNAKLQIAVVKITEARHLFFPRSRELRRVDPTYEEPWRATASVSRLIAGELSPELFLFDRGWGSAACDDGTKMPKRGEEWVLYYLADEKGQPQVLHSYPKKLAFCADRRLLGDGSQPR